MMLKTCPDPVDVQDLQFKLQCRLKIFDNEETSTFKSPSVLSCASRYGLLFIGSIFPNLQVIQTKCLENYNPKEKDISNYPRRNIQLPSPAKQVCVNCDSTILAVVIEQDSCATVIFYDVLSFWKQCITVIKEIRLSSTPGTYVTEINWNPALPQIFTACKSDGTLGVYEIKDTSIGISELPAAAEATSFCWSPKGKQIAVGSKNCKITQYKPDLKAVKVINEPPLSRPHSLISLQWVSNYQFIGIYQSTEPEGSAKMIVIDAPKTGQATYTNYEDICYSGTSRPPQFYTILQPHWNILMVASSNSTELGVLGASGDVWTQWIISDSARAELPLSSKHQETLPIGLALDISPTRPFPWNESAIPPCPYLLLLSHQGVLCIFNVVNLKHGVPTICTPSDPVHDTSGAQQFVTISPQTQQSVTMASVLPQQNIPATIATKAAEPAFSFVAPQGISAAGGRGLTQPQPTYAATGLLFGAKAPENKPLFGGGAIENKSFFGGQATENKPLFGGQNTEAKPLFGGQAAEGQLLFGEKTPESKPQFGGQTGTNPLLGGHTPENKSLLGGQGALTPISPQQLTTQASLFGGQTVITPISKPQSSSTSVVPNDKYSSIYTALAAPVSVTLTVPSKPIVLSIPTVRKKEPAAPEQVTFTQPNASVKTTESRTSVDAKIRSEKQALLTQMIRDECTSLEVELKALLHQGRCVKVNVGTEDEKVEMVTSINSLQEFVKEIVDISIGENSEVHYLKQNLIQCWAWFEEARSRYNCSKDETMSLLLRSQPLDSATEKRQQDLTKLMYYIESQLSQASRALDEQWDNFQDYAKKTYRIKMPTMETIFQTMVRQNAVLQKQSYILKDIASRLKNKSRSASGRSLLFSLENANNLETSLRQLQLEHPRDMSQLHYEQVLKRMKNLSKSKTSKLRNLLKTREVVHITVVKPQLSSSLVLQSPESKSRQRLSQLLAMSTQVSPVAKPTVVPKQLNFMHSTPIREPVDIKPTEVPPNTPQVDGKTFIFKKIEKSSSDVNIVTTASSFVPLAKSASVFSSLPTNQAALPTHAPSAFVPTTQIALGVGTTNKPFSFTPAVATNTTVIKTVASAAPLMPAFSLGPATTSLPKFGASTSKSAVSSTSTPKAIMPTTPTVKTGVSQFSFGSNMTVTPVTLQKKSDAATTADFSLFTANKPTFSFSSISIFDAKTDPTVTDASAASAPSTPTETTLTDLSQASKPLFGSTASSSGTFTFGASSGISKVSAFTAVTSSSTPSSALTDSVSKPESSTTATSTPTVLATTKPLSVVTISSTSSVATTGTSIFSSLPTTTKSFTFGAGSSVTSQPVTSVTTATTSITSAVVTSVVSSTTTAIGETTKPTTKASAPKLSSGEPNTTTANTSSAATTQTASIFGSMAAATSTKSSIFSTPTTSTQPLIIGTSTAAKVTQPSIFGAPTQSSFLKTSTPTTVSSIFESATGTATESSIFAVPLTTSSGSIFGTPITTSPSVFGTTATIASPIFGTQPLLATPTATTPSSVFGSTTQSSAFGSPTATTSIFGGPNTTTSIFGISTPITTSSIFGSTTTTQSSVFGAPISSASTKPSVFGATAGSVFSSSVPTQGSIFGGGVTTSQTSIFNTAAGATPQTSVFGAPTTKPSLFGPAATVTPSVFGGTSPPLTPASFPTSTASSPFGSSFDTTTTTFGQSASIFGAPKTTTSTFGFGGTSVFGSTPATTASVFGQPSTFGNSSSSVFGTPTTTSSNVFATAAVSSTFGTPTTNVFGAPAVSSASFSFANAANAAGTGGSFGFGSLNVGNAATTSGNVFGAGSTFGQSSTVAANPFGRQTTEQKSPFGTNTSIFAAPASTSSSLFGSNTGSGFGGNTQSGFGTSTFGTGFNQQATFGQNTFGGNSFGSSPGPFSGGEAGVAQSGFGSPATFQKPSGFGSPPVFGGSPQSAFGSAPSFGGTPAFGSTPAFGNPSKVFASSSPTGTFGGTATANTGFGGLANQNTIGFGSLAQQASTPNATPFSGSSSFSNWR